MKLRLLPFQIGCLLVVALVGIGWQHFSQALAQEPDPSACRIAWGEEVTYYSDVFRCASGEVLTGYFFEWDDPQFRRYICRKITLECS